ncbi:hypothetical protein MMC13_005405 [Lambiella insularis]|nr:hypothetical protein [Lambiella insularis]
MYAIWKHVIHLAKLPRICLFTASGVFISTFTVEFLWILYRNIRLRQVSCRTIIARQNGAIRMTVLVSRPWTVEVGQYINVWMPISFFSIFQSHPFMVASHTTGANSCIDLLIKPRDGFTRKLYDIAQDYRKDSQEHLRTDLPFGFCRQHVGYPQPSDFRTVILSGPHGVAYPVNDFAKLVIFAEGYGIAAVMQFLHEVGSRHVCLYWQLQHLGDQHPATALLDRALKDHIQSNGYMLQISVYFQHGNLDPSPQLVGERNRSAYFNGQVDVAEQLKRCLGPQLDGHAERVFIAVSANERLRDTLKDAVNSHRHDNLKYVELEYQPSQKTRPSWIFH